MTSVSVHRVMGIETEYGISVPGALVPNPVLASSQIVQAYGNLVGIRPNNASSWDYDWESPLRDARGFDMSRADADPSQLTDEDVGMANVILTNGARLYVDHAHPEYSSPEITNPRDGLIWDRAGMNIMRAAAEALTPHQTIRLFKNNTDNKGASYGTHENYLVRREVPFGLLVEILTPFFVSRQVLTGAGRLGIGQEGRTSRYQMSQRADFFEAEVGLETTIKRPIINTRDEPHADPERYRRLHVIVGDANLSDTATFLKLGTTALVLDLAEKFPQSITGLMPLDPVKEMHAVSHAIDLDHRIALAGGRSYTAVELQWMYWEQASRHVGPHPDPMTQETLDLWSQMLTSVSGDRELAGRTLDWCAKLALMESYRTRDHLAWSDPRLALIDLQYSDVRPDKGLALTLERKGLLERRISEEEVVRAMVRPPSDTRAYFRGECVRRYPEALAAASWDSVVFDIPGEDQLLRVPMLEPIKGTQSMIESVLDAASTASELIAALRGASNDSSD